MGFSFSNVHHCPCIHDELSDLDPSLRQFLLCSRCPFLSPAWTVLCAPTLSSCSCQSSFVPSSNPVLFSPLLFLGPDCVSPSHSAPLSYHNHYPQNPPASPALLVHTECPRDYPLDDTIHQSVLHMPHHLGTAPQLIRIWTTLSIYPDFFMFHPLVKSFLYRWCLTCLTH